ncbi:SCP2 domain-containing protein [Meloidogyne graminicola]|uniref:Hydroxysteroid dehydrogenase-like protein 2 n=1 Tax=Meloidogyne graminicola TaxID=189291 RepID=A0A8S9ZMV0_9BILA|nr:SCP2 domain-containing protein [Meloidogyne graminicola]
MLNTGKFFGKTALITGASRGIGKEIALKLAKDGANIVICAKTAKEHATLSGTIFSAAEEIEKNGGKALPIQVDVREEAQVQDAVEKAVHKFGGIDILVNNASAIHLTGTLDTPMKRYDLMHQINVRGTFLVSQKCVPYLRQAKNPHILNLSPPLLMQTQWFSKHCAYTMSKYGMSMCVLGMHEEFRKDNIAVNALWPKTAIWTAALDMLTAGKGKLISRKPDIVSDAAYVILSRSSKEFTGNFCLDEDILKEAGITDFSQYSYEKNSQLLPDLFVPGVDYNHPLWKKMLEKSKI